MMSRFQSTRPAWGATIYAVVPAGENHDFNPHAPRGARPCSARIVACVCRFQSTRPAWGATEILADRLARLAISIHTPRVGRDHFIAATDSHGNISIHTPRVGRDVAQGGVHPARRDFNPHAPRGARRRFRSVFAAADRFQSTRPAWGATIVPYISSQTLLISIHTPRVGRDSRRSRAPAPRAISIHTPRVGRDGASRCIFGRRGLFQSTRPAWGATTLS